MPVLSSSARAASLATFMRGASLLTMSSSSWASVSRSQQARNSSSGVVSLVMAHHPGTSRLAHGGVLKTQQRGLHLFGLPLRDPELRRISPRDDAHPSVGQPSLV